MVWCYTTGEPVTADYVRVREALLQNAYATHPSGGNNVGKNGARTGFSRLRMRKRMPIPDFQTLMVPVLRQLQDGQSHSSREIRDNLATQLGLTDAELVERIPSGRVTTWYSRVAWAVQHLYQARAIARTGRGVYSIADRGRTLLAEHPDRIVISHLEQFEEFREFRARSHTATATNIETTTPTIPLVDDQSVIDPPYIRARAAANEADAEVASDLLLRINQQPPDFLERVVLQLLVAMGYAGAMGNEHHLGKSGDEGIDGVIDQDALGLDRIYIQAKRYASGRTVGRPEIQSFVGALHGARAQRGVFITTSRFSAEARTYLNYAPQRIVLLDGDELTRLMVKHGVGVQTEETIILSKVDEDFFE